MGRTRCVAGTIGCELSSSPALPPGADCLRLPFFLRHEEEEESEDGLFEDMEEGEGRSESADGEE